MRDESGLGRRQKCDRVGPSTQEARGGFDTLVYGIRLNDGQSARLCSSGREPPMDGGHNKRGVSVTLRERGVWSRTMRTSVRANAWGVGGRCWGGGASLQG